MGYIYHVREQLSNELLVNKNGVESPQTVSIHEGPQSTTKNVSTTDEKHHHGI